MWYIYSMVIKVMGELDLEKYLEKDVSPFVLVDIVTPDTQPVVEKSNIVVDIYRIFCYDIDIAEDPYDGDGAYATEKDFKGFKAFIDRYRDTFGEIIVKCGGGISRSAGVAAALIDYLGVDRNIWVEREYFPNILLYVLATNELGIYKTKEEIIRLFDLRSKHSRYHYNSKKEYFLECLGDYIKH